MQEITGAKPVGDANFHRRVVYGEKQTHLTQNQAALDVQVVSGRPISIALKALVAMHSLGKRIQLGATPSEGSTAVEPALRRVS